MLALSDSQLQTLMTFAAEIPQEERSLFLARVGVMLRVRHRFTDSDVDEVAKPARTGLAHLSAA